MPEPPARPYDAHRRRRAALVAGLCVTLALLLAACPLSAVAMHQGIIAPPHFSFSVRGVEFAAPCPRRKFICDDTMAWYAIWRGDREPDGTITYRQLFFVYLKPRRR